MRLLLQRVLEASVSVDGHNIAHVGTGLLVLVGFGQGDGPRFQQSPAFAGMARKLVELRIFPGEGDYADKMHCSVQDAGGSILLVPQFTLYAGCRRGRRPDFTGAAAPAHAAALFDSFVAEVRRIFPGRLGCGQFGADMRVSLCNWGPVTILLDSDELFSQQR